MNAYRLRVVDGPVETGEVGEFELCRRDALRRGLGLSGAVVAAASIPLLLGVRTAFAQTAGDAAILRSAVGLEQTAVRAYEIAATSGILTGGVQRTARRFRDQEQEHADALSAALKVLGGVPPAVPSTAEDPSALAGLARVQTVAGFAAFAIELESAAIAAYHEAQLKLQDGRLLQTIASIMANEGQHLVVLRSLLDLPPVPSAFEVGRA